MEGIRLKDNDILLKKFNNRDSHAFGLVYNKFYKEFHLYASSLYENTNVEAADAVQDIFIHIWQQEKIKFDNFLNLKAFVIIAIKNRYKSYINHLKYEKKYIQEIDDRFEFDVIENRIYSYVDEVLKLLPQECAKVFKLYIEGWRPEDIAEKLNKNIQTIYNVKQKSIAILRKKLQNDKLLIFLILFR